MQEVVPLQQGILNLYTKEGVELLCFLTYIIGSKDKVCQWLSADFQYGQTEKNLFAVLSNVTDLDTVSENVVLILLRPTNFTVV